MSKVWKAVITVIILIIIAISLIGFFGLKKASNLLSESLSSKLKVPVKVEGISLSWNRITIKGLEIDNIKDSILPKAFSAKTIIIKAPLFHYMKKHVEIQQVIVDDIYIGLEFDNIESEKGNWTRLIENFYTVMDNYEKKDSERTVTIKKISLQKIQAQVVYKTSPKKIHAFPIVEYEEFTDITSQGGFPIDQITNSVLGKMLMSLFVRENIKNMYKQFLNPKNVLKSLISPFKLLIP